MTDTVETTPENLAWTCHPVRRRPIAGLLAALVVALLTAGVWTWFEDPWLTSLGVAILAFSLSPFYLPTRYLIAQDSVTIRATFGERKKNLDLYRRFHADRYGALLSPFDRPSRLDRFHGLNLRFDAPDRERVIDYLKRRFPGRPPATAEERAAGE
jgi:hypothetical protein